MLLHLKFISAVPVYADQPQGVFTRELSLIFTQIIKIIHIIIQLTFGIIGSIQLVYPRNHLIDFLQLTAFLGVIYSLDIDGFIKWKIVKSRLLTFPFHINFLFWLNFAYSPWSIQIIRSFFIHVSNKFIELKYLQNWLNKNVQRENQNFMHFMQRI